jgi:hypothetical protein
MGILYEKMRQYCWLHGWRPFKMVEDGREVLAWRNEEHDRECQDLADAYQITRLNREVTKRWR